ncbi:lipopolysaccharide biosynthesis protein [Massilimicrobiota timonensis]|uniref:lipopolysaccharide biosynthesis protein n=1 Tax=Massilimicrobiota timonensis TaxID=1776392 RepID=UPI00101BD5AD|nr:oligosaccharide flippase family protein [Massilimicrobiota timonensis]
MKKKIKLFLGSNYFKSFLILSSSSILVQLLNLFISPILTRLYSSDQLGAYTLAISIISIVGPIICGRFDLSIVTSKNKIEEANLICLSFLFTILITFITAIWFIHYLIVNPNIYNHLGIYSFLVIFSLIITGISNILISYNNKNKQYKLISQVTLLRGCVQSFGQVLGGLFNFGSKGLVLAYFIGSCFGLKKQSTYLGMQRKMFKTVTRKNMLVVLKKYKKQLIFGTPSNFINGLSYSILNFFITSLYGLSTFGYYSLSYRMLGIPLTLIGSNMAKIFFQEASEEYNKTKKFRKSLKKNSVVISVISIFVTIVLILICPTLFPVIFGKEWINAGRYIVILAPMFGIRLIVSVFSAGLIVANKQNIELIYQCLFILFGGLCYFISKFYLLTINQFLILISISYSFVYILLYGYICIINKK